MSSDLGSLDEVLRDDDLCSALSERRLDDIPFGDDLGDTLAGWCESLAYDHPTHLPVSVADLAAAACRRRSLRLAGRSVAVAAAVAAVCVGGLMISKLSVQDNNQPGTPPGAPDVTGVSSSDVQSPSQQTRARIWQELQDARTALVQHRWSTASALLAAARQQLSAVTPADGRAALNTWLSELSGALDDHATLTKTSAVGPAFGPYVTYSGVPMPPGMTAPPGSMPTDGTASLPPPLPPMSSPAPPSAPSPAPSDSPSANPPSSGPVEPPSSDPTSPSAPPSTQPSQSPSPAPSPSPTLPSGPVYGPSPSPIPPNLVPPYR